MSKHTPGPWKAELWKKGLEQRESYEIFADDEDETYIAAINDDNPDHKANAQLIAAAPKLLKVAKRTLSALKSSGIEEKHNITIQKLKEIIAEAEGDANGDN